MNSCPKCNKSPNLVTLVPIYYLLQENIIFKMANTCLILHFSPYLNLHQKMIYMLDSISNHRSLE